MSKFVKGLRRFLHALIWNKFFPSVFWAICGVAAIGLVITFAIGDILRASPEEIAAHKAELAAVDLSKCTVYAIEDREKQRYKIDCAPKEKKD